MSYDGTKPSVSNPGLSDIEAIRNNLNALRNNEASQTQPGTTVQGMTFSQIEPRDDAPTQYKIVIYIRNHDNTSWEKLYDEEHGIRQVKGTGNNNGDVPVSNGTLCSNLNADMVDGKNYNDIQAWVQTWVNDNADVPNANYADNAGNSGNSDKLENKTLSQIKEEMLMNTSSIETLVDKTITTGTGNETYLINPEGADIIVAYINLNSLTGLNTNDYCRLKFKNVPFINDYINIFERNKDNQANYINQISLNNFGEYQPVDPTITIDELTPLTEPSEFILEWEKPTGDPFYDFNITIKLLKIWR